MAVRYSPIFAGLMIVAGLGIGFGGLFLGRPTLLGLGALNFLVGLGYAFQPWFIVHEDSIEMKNVLGMTLKRHPVGLKDLVLRGGKLEPKSGGKPRLGGILAREADIQAIAAKLP
jgi:hypothetical protein